MHTKPVYLFFALMCLFISAPVLALDPIYAENGNAIQGYDPVAYFEDEKAIKGDPDYTYEWNGATWSFTTDRHRQLFVANPEKYAPQYGGYCAYSVAKGAAAPVQPEAWTIHEGKLYLNFNNSIRKTWRKDIQGYIRKADTNWPSVL